MALEEGYEGDYEDSYDDDMKDEMFWVNEVDSEKELEESFDGEEGSDFGERALSFVDDYSLDEDFAMGASTDVRDDKTVVQEDDGLRDKKWGSSMI